MEKMRKYDYSGNPVESGMLELLCDGIGCGVHIVNGKLTERGLFCALCFASRNWVRPAAQKQPISSTNYGSMIIVEVRGYSEWFRMRKFTENPDGSLTWERGGRTGLALAGQWRRRERKQRGGAI